MWWMKDDMIEWTLGNVYMMNACYRKPLNGTQSLIVSILTWANLKPANSYIDKEQNKENYLLFSMCHLLLSLYFSYILEYNVK